MKASTRILVPTLALAAIVGNGTGRTSEGAAAPPGGVLLVRASPAVSPCTAAVAAAMAEATGRRARVETAKIGPVGSARGADVVVAVEQELTRVLEGGESANDLDVDVAAIPWVFVGGDGDGTDLEALARSARRVSVFGGAISRHAQQSLESLPPDRVRCVRDASLARSLPEGELALVPLSLAGPGPVSAAEVPPLRVRAVGARDSPRREEARAFLEFLTGPLGQAAFSRCGRDTAQ
jgi:hypothetical protein